MQRQGGGKQRGGSKATPSQRGGGNDPTCGCDMQAGWPPASEFPRGGIQGGGSWNFNEFNLALTKNGRTRHLRGRWNANGNRRNNNNNNNNNNSNSNSNSNSNNNGNLFVPRTPNYEARSPEYEPRTPNYEARSPEYEPRTPEYPANAAPAKKSRNKTNKKKVTSAPNGYSNLAYKGKKYYKKINSGEVFEIKKNGELGNSMGFYVTPKSGKPYITQMPPPLETETLVVPVNRLSEPITPPPKTLKNTMNLNVELPPEAEDSTDNIESEPPQNENKSMKSLSMNGGKRKRRHHTKRRHTKRKGTKRR